MDARRQASQIFTRLFFSQGITMPNFWTWTYHLACYGFIADAHTGQNTFIGIENLCKITRRKERAIRYRLRCLEAAKLIQCTADAKGGRGHAAVYVCAWSIRRISLRS